VNVLAFLLTAVFVPMLVNEFTDWLPWLAARLIKAAARTLPCSVRPRYAEEWLAELDAVPGKLAKLALAGHIFVRAPATAAAINGLPSSRAMTVKTLFDKAAAATTLILIAPLLAAIAIAIRITVGGPIFSRQTMIGKDGQPFALLKFRTFSMVDDEAITWVGYLLRRWSVDEIPQLFNVLFGDMSLVGPRPVLPDDYVRSRLVAKPGITGLLQVVGRTDLSRDEVERLDRRYAESWSLALDLQILWRVLSDHVGRAGVRHT